MRSAMSGARKDFLLGKGMKLQALYGADSARTVAAIRRNRRMLMFIVRLNPRNPASGPHDSRATALSNSVFAC